MINQEWTIQSRTHACAVTTREFSEGETFYTLLFDEKSGYRREDLSEQAFKDRPADAPPPFSFWRTKYTPPAPPPHETLGKASAEDLLRHYMAEDTPQHTNARYLLAVMLERKRILKEVETKRADDGSLTRIYEHAKSGEVFVIPDPQLRLDQLAEVQAEVADYLAPDARSTAR
ncbi:MAG: hypothetical protein ABI680_07470 [Chthoniobacteraceae bacterium]